MTLKTTDEFLEFTTLPLDGLGPSGVVAGFAAAASGFGDSSVFAACLLAGAGLFGDVAGLYRSANFPVGMIEISILNFGDKVLASNNKSSPSHFVVNLHK
uniref:Uncharacterized protein n=1 Tax=Romanomermis culicivorax TaxID=13658 RepID=A0A915JPX8_ROMCU